MINKCLIVSGGEFSIPNNIDFGLFDYIIACDRAYLYCDELGIKPSVIVGDFDSAEQPNTDIPIKKFPSRKDDTDTMLAIKHALDLGVKDITIICALGNRLDHAYANIQSGLYAESRNCKLKIMSKDTVISFVNSEKLIYPKCQGWSFSCFSVSNICKGVSITGSKYEVKNVTLTNNFPIGVSNTWESDSITVECEEGTLVIIESKLKSGEHI